jgi:internalin A
VTDFAWLGNMANLKSLNLSGCTKLSDISFLSQTPRLKKLTISVENISTRKIDKVTAFDLPNNVKTFNISDYCVSLVTDFSPIGYSEDLESLSLSGCTNLKDVSFLAYLPQLDDLIINRCPSLSNISAISKLYNLNFLNLSWCKQISDLSPLKKLYSLHFLDISNCPKISELSPLSDIEPYTLAIYGCKKIKDLSPLADNENLRLLVLGKYHDISGLGNLNNYPYLTISYL